MKSKSLFFIFLMVCLVFFLTGCDSGGGGGSSDSSGKSDPYPNINVTAYVPDEFAGNVVAIYNTAAEIGSETIGGIEYVTKSIDSVILFDNNEWVKTEVEIYINKNTGVQDDSKTDKDKDARGTYAFTSGNFNNGAATITMTHEWNEGTSSWDVHDGTFNITIKNSSFTADDDKYTKTS